MADNGPTLGIINQPGYDTDEGVFGYGYSPDNGKHFYVTDTIRGRKYRQEDADQLWKYLEPKISELIDKKLSQFKEGDGTDETSHDGSSAGDKS